MFFISGCYLFSANCTSVYGGCLVTVLPLTAGFSQFTAVLRGVTLLMPFHSLYDSVIQVTKNYFYGVPTKVDFSVLDSTVKSFRQLVSSGM